MVLTQTVTVMAVEITSETVVAGNGVSVVAVIAGGVGAGGAGGAGLPAAGTLLLDVDVTGAGGADDAGGGDGGSGGVRVNSVLGQVGHSVRWGDSLVN